MFNYSQAIFNWFKDDAIKLVYDHDLDKNSIVVDIGGYKGIWAGNIIDKYNCNIIIYEPVKTYFTQLENNISKYNKAYFSEKIPDRSYLIFSNKSNQLLIKDELLKLRKNKFRGFVVENDNSVVNELDELGNVYISLNQVESFIDSGASIILTADMFITVSQQYGLNKIKDWANQIFFAKISNWILSQGIYDIYRNNVIRWAYDKVPRENPQIIADILTLFLILYGPKSLNQSKRIESLANYDKYQLENI